MKKKICLIAVVVCALAALVVPRLTFDRAAWLRDFDALEGHVAAVYANLEWIRDKRGLDLAALHTETRAALDSASTDRQARAAIRAFVDRFEDPHFRVSRVKLSKRLEKWWRERDGASAQATPPAPSSTSSVSGIPWSAPASAACAILGFDTSAPAMRLAIAGASPVDASDPVSALFPSAIVDGAKKLGTIRIASFDTYKHGAACDAAWTARQQRDKSEGVCDDDCQDELRYVDAPNVILAALGRRIEQMKAAAVTMIVVDITGNGGGTDWVDPAARMFSARTLPCPRVGYIRHPHWQKRFAQMRDDLRPALVADGGALASTLIAQLDRLVDDANVRCDRSGIWSGVDPGCALVGSEPYYACGLVESIADDVVIDAALRSRIWRTAGYTFARGAWSGELAVLVDSATSSAAEHFGAVLQDGRAAIIVGEETDGSGCGYTRGGVPITLPHSGMKIEMSDCVRYRADGTNEIEGITPDIVATRADIERDIAAVLARAAK